MSRQDANAAFALSSFLQGANATYIDELYARYEKDPASVDPEWQEFFKSLKDPPADAENILRRVRQLRFDLNFISKAEDKQFVYWLERRGRGVFLRASPVDVSGLLQDRLFEKVPTVVLTSATLSSGGNFRFIRERLGLEEAEEMIA